MRALKQIRWTAFAIFVVGLFLAMSSGRVEQEALTWPEGSYAHYANAMSARLFTVAAVFILIWAQEMQRAKTTAKIQELEEQINRLANKAA